MAEPHSGPTFSVCKEGPLVNDMRVWFPRMNIMQHPDTTAGFAQQEPDPKSLRACNRFLPDTHNDGFAAGFTH